MMTSIIAPILVFAVIVLVHEGGHFVTAKLTGMRVDEFAVGFGPKLWSCRRGETEYSLRLIPLGGYNKIAGMEPGPSKDPRAFSNKPYWARLMVICAGSFMNIILAFLIFTGVIYSVGIQHFPDIPVVGEVLSDSPAARAGIEKGDRIKTIGSASIEKWMDIPGAMKDKASRVVAVTIERNGAERTLTVIPQASEEGRAVVGIMPYVESRSVSMGEAAFLGFDRCGYILKMVVYGIAGAVTGSGNADVAGPIGVARMAGDVAVVGIAPFLLFIAVLSLNLGFLNLLPVPMLDGGLFFITLVEMVTRRKLPEKALYYVQMTGLTILIALFLFATMKDITALIK